MWMPVDQYVGGVEHAILHLLYSRFFIKVLHDMGLVEFDEPFKAMLNQGQVINQGKSMSKSLGNGVDLGEQLAAFGVDAVRMTMLFAGPPEEDIDWADMNVPALGKFLARAWRLAAEVRSEVGVDVTTGDLALRRVTHRTVHDVTHLLDTFRFNVAIARVMELVNAIRKTVDVGPGPADPAVREAVEAVAVMLSLFAPYTAEDAWARLGHQPTVFHAGWPVVDHGLLVEESVVCVVQINGKVRDRLDVAPDIDETALRELALAAPAVVKALDGREVRTVIVRAPKLVNVVV
jgi:leucyl-tRNA synthetase